MKKPALFLMAALTTAVLSASTHSGFGLDAFNRAVSAATRGNMAFSPVSFEIDGVLFSEAFGALTRAKFAETLGVLNGLESVYKPIHEELSKTEGRKTSFLHARAFCLPNERKAHPAYRKWLQDAFSAEMFSFDFRKGAECWFQSRMDGEMEEFKIPDKAAKDGSYSFFDLVSFRCSWQEPFPTNNTRSIKFQLADGSSRVLPAMCDLRSADVWERKNLTILRLPLADSSWFYALLPKQGLTVRDIRGELNSSTIVTIVAGIKSLTEDGISHGATAVVIPKIDITAETDLKLPFGYFRFPMTDMERMEAGIRPNFIRQRVRFQLDEQGLDDMATGDKPTDQIVRASQDTTRFILNRPFLFFVLHEPTSSMLVVGQFTGH